MEAFGDMTAYVVGMNVMELGTGTFATYSLTTNTSVDLILRTQFSFGQGESRHDLSLEFAKTITPHCPVFVQPLSSVA